MASPNKKRGANVTQGNDKEFWTNLGIQIGQTFECSKSMRDEFHKFVSNDHAHLTEKVDKLGSRIAYIVGGITAASWILQVILNVWKK